MECLQGLPAATLSALHTCDLITPFSMNDCPTPAQVKKSRKKRKPRYPAGYNPELPGGGLPPPNPERWLPKWERAEFKKKRDKRKREKDAVKGSQVGAGSVFQEGSIDARGAATGGEGRVMDVNDVDSGHGCGYGTAMLHCSVMMFGGMFGGPVLTAQGLLAPRAPLVAGTAEISPHLLRPAPPLLALSAHRLSACPHVSQGAGKVDEDLDRSNAPAPSAAKAQPAKPNLPPQKKKGGKK